jgi:hypothetical protein
MDGGRTTSNGRELSEIIFQIQPLIYDAQLYKTILYIYVLKCWEKLNDNHMFWSI